MRRKEPQDTNWNQTKPEHLEAAQLTQLVLLQGQLIIGNGRQDATEIGAEIHLKGCIKLSKLTIANKRVLLCSVRETQINKHKRSQTEPLPGYLLRRWQENGIVVKDICQHSGQQHKDAQHDAIELLAPASKAMSQYQYQQA